MSSFSRTCRLTSSGRPCATTSGSRPSRSAAGCDTSVPSWTSTSFEAPAQPASAIRSRWPPVRPREGIMADLITRPDSRPETGPDSRPSFTTGSLPDRLLDTQSPQRPQSSPRIRIEVDGRVIEGWEGQTTLEVCRNNGIETPPLCYEPKLPGLGACGMWVVEVEGEKPPPISCSRTCE